MENFVDQDQQKVDQYFVDRAAELKKRYGERIQTFMMSPIVENVYRKFAVDAAGLPTSTERDQNSRAICPLFQ